VKNWLRDKIFQPLLALLSQGIAPDRLALYAAIALVFRLNLAAIQIVQASMAPTQLLLIIPFVRLGEWILRAPRRTVSINFACGVRLESARPIAAPIRLRLHIRVRSGPARFAALRGGCGSGA
jgi:hypothetical protein